MSQKNRELKHFDHPDLNKVLDFTKENFSIIQKINSNLVNENIDLSQKIDKLNFLINKMKVEKNSGRIKIDLDIFLNLVFFERYVFKQSSCYLVYYDNHFVKFEPIERLDGKAEDKESKNLNFDSLF